LGPAPKTFSIEIEISGRCGGSVRVIACIKDQGILDRILAHLESKDATEKLVA
jgi:hypothetical protein